MSEKRDSKQWCPNCKKSYVNLRLHLRSGYHQRHLVQCPLFAEDREVSELREAARADLVVGRRA